MKYVTERPSEHVCVMAEVVAVLIVGWLQGVRYERGIGGNARQHRARIPTGLGW
jgi:hypothetical protein